MLVKSVVAKSLLIAHSMESVILITLDIGNGGLSGWNHSIKVVVIHGGSLCISSSFKNRPNWTFKGRNRDNHAFTK